MTTDWSKVSGNKKVEMCIEMTDFVLEVCAAGIRACKPNISEEKLIEELRKRINFINCK